MTKASQRGLGREEYTHVYEANAHRLSSRRRLARLVIFGNGSLGLLLVTLGALRNDRLLLLVGASFVALAILLGLLVATRVTDRMLLIHARVLRAHPAHGSDDDASLAVEILAQLRMRPDGFCRSDPPRRVRCTLSISSDVWKEIGLVPSTWSDVRLLATSDGFVFSTLAAARTTTRSAARPR